MAELKMRNIFIAIVKYRQQRAAAFAASQDNKKKRKVLEFHSALSASRHLMELLRTGLMRPASMGKAANSREIASYLRTNHRALFTYDLTPFN